MLSKPRSARLRQAIKLEEQSQGAGEAILPEHEKAAFRALVDAAPPASVEVEVEVEEDPEDFL